MGFIDYVAEYFRGPQGETGPTGPPGENGAPGASGVPGPQGEPGGVSQEIYVVTGSFLMHDETPSVGSGIASGANEDDIVISATAWLTYDGSGDPIPLKLDDVLTVDRTYDGNSWNYAWNFTDPGSPTNAGYVNYRVVFVTA